MTSEWKMPEQLTFEVKYHKKASSASVFLDADLVNFKIKIYRKRIFEHDKKARCIDAGLILQISKALENERLLTILWKADKSVNKKLKEKTEKYTFRNAEERQKFYEAATWCRWRGKIAADATEDVTVFIGSWNMGNTPPPSALAAWIPRNKYTIYFIGLQESSYTQPKEFKSCEEHLISVFKAHMGATYELIAVHSMLEIRFLLFIHKDHVHKVSNVEKGNEATGLAHVVGNKGAVAVALAYHETTLCFVNSHLAAHQEHVEMRNQNYREIVEELHLGNPAFDITNHFAHAFWTGDLNYRIDIERSKCLELIANKDWPALRAADQLINQRDKLGKVFRGWNEGQLAFPPTYRYTRGTKTYNDEKARIPAWCDRVMWKSLPDTVITQHEYTCCDDIQTSDHHPIYSTFTIAAKLPNIPHEPRMTTIRVTDLRGSNLVSKDSNGFSDPYVVFTSPVLGEEKRTVIIEKTLDPVYNDEDVPPLRACIANKAFLCTQHLFLIVRDYDHASKDDEMGQCAVSLKNACGSRPAPFKVPVVLNGVYWGTLEGKVHVVWGEGQRKKGRMEGLSSLIDRVRRLDDAQAREAITRYAANESDPRAALLALLHADSLTYGARILQEVEHVAPGGPRGSVSRSSKPSGEDRKDSKVKSSTDDRKDSQSQKGIKLEDSKKEKK